MHSMVEPYRSRFIEMVRNGAGTRDIHDRQSGAFADHAKADDRLLHRELDRVRLHTESLCVLLEQYVGASANVLDVGCGTGGTTVAMALAAKLGVTSIVGIDPSEDAVAAAEMRAKAYSVESKASFQCVPAGTALPFDSNRFDLTTCVSVLEFVSDVQARRQLVAELCRVTAPGGAIVLFTPNPLRLSDYHTHRFLGDVRHAEGMPWSSTPWSLRSMFDGCDVRFLRGEQLMAGLRRRRIPGASLLRYLPILPWFLPWQKVIARKRA